MGEDGGGENSQGEQEPSCSGAREHKWFYKGMEVAREGPSGRGTVGSWAHLSIWYPCRLPPPPATGFGVSHLQLDPVISFYPWEIEGPEGETPASGDPPVSRSDQRPAGCSPLVVPQQVFPWSVSSSEDLEGVGCNKVGAGERPWSSSLGASLPLGMASVLPGQEALAGDTRDRPEVGEGMQCSQLVWFPALPPPSCVTLGKSLYLSEPQFSNLPNEHEKSTY